MASYRGTHNRGVFTRTLGKKGVVIRPAGLENPNQIGRIVRRDNVLTQMARNVIKETSATRQEAIDMVPSGCLNTSREISGHWGLGPVQFILSRPVRHPLEEMKAKLQTSAECRHMWMDPQRPHHKQNADYKQRRSL